MKQIIQAIGLLFILGIGVPSFAATPTVVQKNVNSVPSGATNLGKAFTAATTAGNTILASCSAPTTTATLSVSDTINTYTAVGSAPTTQATAGSLQWFVAKNTTSIPNSTNITCTQTGAAGGMFIFIYEIAGGSTTAPVDVPTVAQASGAAITSSATPSFTLPATTVAHDLLIFASSCANTCSADASADAGTSQNDTIGDTAETYAKSATGTYTGLFNQTAGAAIVVGVAITDGVGGGGGGGGATVNKRAKLEKMYSALKTQISGMGAVVAAIPTLDPLTGMFVWRGDLTHQSADTTQTILTTTNVTGTSFKKTWQFATADADIKTQPLIAANVRFSDKVRNVTYIASMANTAYALDADTGQLLWKTDLNAGEAPANATDVMSCNDVIGTVGVISSGAIDPITRTIYYLAKTEVAGPTFKYRMHALDIVTGAERPGSPVLVTATVAGTGAGSSGGNISLDPHHNNNTSGAVIANGPYLLHVFIAL
jgi:outer membrane protein assembly factor BamB